jgi:hypothetical protein
MLCLTGEGAIPHNGGVRDRWGLGMSAVEIIVTALAVGAGAGVQNTASAAVADAYSSLKQMLRGRLSDREQVVRALDADETDLEVWRAQIGDDLVHSGAAQDEQIIAVARRLLALAGPDVPLALDVDVTTSYGAVGQFAAPVTFNQEFQVPPTPPAAS